MSDANTKSDNPTGILEGYTPAKPFTPDSEMRERVGLVMRKFFISDRNRRTYEHNWEFYKLYLQGNQLVGKDLTTGQTVRVSLRPEDSKRLLSIENLLSPTARACVGKLSRIIPGWEILPRTDDLSEMRAAMVATSFLEYIAIKESLRVKYLRAQRTLMWCGTAIFQLCWHREAGENLSWCKVCRYEGDLDKVGTPCPRCTMQFEMEAIEANTKRGLAHNELSIIAAEHGTLPPEPPPQAQPKEAPLLVRANNGDIVVENIDPREFFPEPGVSDPAKLRWVILRRARPVAELRDDFPEFAQYIKAEGGIYTDRSVRFYGNLSSSQTETSYLEDNAYHYEVHEAPSAKHREGRILHIINNIEVKVTPNYYFQKLGRLPFYFQWFERRDGELWGEAPIAQAWHMQRERNRLRTQLREHRELTLRPKLLKPQKTKLGVDEITTTPGEILEYNSFAGIPKYLDLPAIPVYAYEDLQQLASGIKLQFGVTDQEMGDASGDQSGRFAAILEAQSSESIAPILVENTEEWKQLGRGILILGQSHYSPDRLWTVNGKERVRTGSFSKANLKPGWDIQISETDSLSKNPALRQQQTREYLNDGVFTDMRTGIVDMRLYMRTAGLKLPGSGPDVSSAEHAYAAAIPEKMAKGEPFQPKPWDDARICVEELVGWLRGEGRNAPDELQFAVGQVFQFYLSMMPATPADLNLMGMPGVPNQPPMQAGAPSGFGSGAMPGQAKQGQQPAQPQSQAPVAQQAAQTVKAADKAGEQAARGTQKHEG